MGLAVVDHHQALVLTERQVASCGDVSDAKRLAPAQVAPAPAAESGGKCTRGPSPSPPVDTTVWGHGSSSPSPLLGSPNLPQGPKIFLRTPQSSRNPIFSGRPSFLRAPQMSPVPPVFPDPSFSPPPLSTFSCGTPDLSLRTPPSPNIFSSRILGLAPSLSWAPQIFPQNSPVSSSDLARPSPPPRPPREPQPPPPA